MILQDWIEDNLLKVEILIENVLFKVGGDTFFLLQPKTDKIVDKKLNFKLNKKDRQFLADKKPDNILFQFGERYYFSSIDYQLLEEERCINAKFNDFKFVGDCSKELIKYCNFGIHSEYELLNGSHSADLWCQKASFLGYNSVALCDKNTLAGTISFQSSCKKYGLKSIIGETLTVKMDRVELKDNLYDVKLYVKNEKGWENLLLCSNRLNVENNSLFVEENFLLEHSEGLVLVFPPKSSFFDSDYSEAVQQIKEYSDKFDDIFYQIDSSEFVSDSIDSDNLKNLKAYFYNYKEFLKPIAFSDSFYVDKEQGEIKYFLNSIGKKNTPKSDEQYFKTFEEQWGKLEPLFKNSSNFEEFFYLALLNNLEISNVCNFQINTGEHKLPKFEAVTRYECLSEEDFQSKTFEFWNNIGIVVDDNDSLFIHLLAEGFQNKLGNRQVNFEEYYERLNKEIEVISGAGFADYFLILWDAIRWSKSQNIMVGNARGSVAGSLVAYLLDITSVDPIEYDLLFERFLNESRVLPETVFEVELENGEKIVFKKGEKIALMNGSECIADESLDWDNLDIII